MSTNEISEHSEQSSIREETVPHDDNDNDDDDDGSDDAMITSTTTNKKMYLAEDYVLHSYDVICGRGRTCFQHEGNARFRRIVREELRRYVAAKTKTDKTVIIQDIITRIRETSPTQGGGFVKYDKIAKRYYEVGDFLAREKTSQAFRDILHEQYKSSNAKKRHQRKVMRENKQGLLSGDSEEQQSTMTPSSSPRHPHRRTSLSDASDSSEVTTKKKNDNTNNSNNNNNNNNDNDSEKKLRTVSSSSIEEESRRRRQDRKTTTTMNVDDANDRIRLETKNGEMMILPTTTLLSSKLPIWWETDTGVKTIPSNLNRQQLDLLRSSSSCMYSPYSMKQRQPQQQLERDFRHRPSSTTSY